MKKFLMLFMFFALIGLVAAADTSSVNYDVKVIDDAWGGVITDDGTHFFIIKQGSIGISQTPESIKFYTLPPFIPTSDIITGEDGSSGETPRSPPADITEVEATFGVFLDTKPGFPDTECTLHLESYPEDELTYQYEYWLGPNLLSQPGDSFDGGNGRVEISRKNAYTDTKTLKAPRTGEYWCKVKVKDAQGRVLVEAAQMVESKRTINFTGFLLGQDPTAYLFGAIVIIILAGLIIWAVYYKKKQKKKK